MFLRVLFIIYLLGLAYLYKTAKGKDQQLFNELNEKDYPLKRYLTMGHFIMKLCRYKYRSIYDEKMAVMFNQIYGTKKGQDYLKIHWANQVTMVLILILLFLMLSAILGTIDGGFILFMLVVVIATIYGLNQEVHKKIKERQIQIKLDFTEFLSKLILLVNAGLNLTPAWEKIVADHTSNRALYQELRITAMEIKNGKSEVEAYEDFANRCRNPVIYKFVSLTLQNLKKGNEEIALMLKLLTNECWEMRKNVAKTLGEEASTKLLIPIMIMFIAILLIVITPALLVLMTM